MAVEPKSHLKAFASYSGLRRRQASTAYLKKLEERLRSYDGNLEHLTKVLRGERPSKKTTQELVREVTRLQTLRRDCSEEFKKVESAIESGAPVSDMDLWTEFERICSIPQLIRVQTDADMLTFLIRARHLHENRLYDFGDWRIPISLQKPMSKLSVTKLVYEVRSGLVPGWPGGPPVYRLQDRQFCFGDNQAVIDSYFRAGKIEAGLQVATYALCQVNKGDETNVPHAFKQVA